MGSISADKRKAVELAMGQIERQFGKGSIMKLGGQIFAKQSASLSIPETRDTSNLGVLALKHYNKAKDYLRQGNWAEYGRELENLEKILEKISSITKEKI